jgi:hypothetical protein
MLFKRLYTYQEGKRRLTLSWNFLFFSSRSYSGDQKDIFVDADKSLILHSPRIDGELKVDGEAYIL